MANKLCIMSYLTIWFFTIFILLLEGTIMLIYFKKVMVIKSFPDSCYLNTTTKLTNLITTTTSSQTTTESFITTETTSITTYEITQDQFEISSPVLTTIKIGCSASTECIQNPIALPNNISILSIGCVNQICTCLNPNTTYVHAFLACKLDKDGSCTYTEECAYGTCNNNNKCTGKI